MSDSVPATPSEPTSANPQSRVVKAPRKVSKFPVSKFPPTAAPTSTSSSSSSAAAVITAPVAVPASAPAPTPTTAKRALPNGDAQPQAKVARSCPSPTPPSASDKPTVSPTVANDTSPPPTGGKGAAPLKPDATTTTKGTSAMSVNPTSSLPSANKKTDAPAKEKESDAVLAIIKGLLDAPTPEPTIASIKPSSKPQDIKEAEHIISVCTPKYITRPAWFLLERHGIFKTDPAEAYKELHQLLMRMKNVKPKGDGLNKDCINAFSIHSNAGFRQLKKVKGCRDLNEPVIPHEPQKFRRMRRSKLFWDVITEAECFKLRAFHITWDCVKCPCVFLDGGSLNIHKKLYHCPVEPGKSPLNGLLFCQFCCTGMGTETAAIAHKRKLHWPLPECRVEIQLIETAEDVLKLRHWGTKSHVDIDLLEGGINQLQRLAVEFIHLNAQLISPDGATRQLAAREQFVLMEEVLRAAGSASTTLTFENVPAHLAQNTDLQNQRGFQVMSLLQEFGLFPGALCSILHEARKHRNIVFHEAGVVLDPEVLKALLEGTKKLMAWAGVFLDRLSNICTMAPEGPMESEIKPLGRIPLYCGQEDMKV